MSWRFKPAHLVVPFGTSPQPLAEEREMQESHYVHFIHRSNGIIWHMCEKGRSGNVGRMSAQPRDVLGIIESQWIARYVMRKDSRGYWVAMRYSDEAAGEISSGRRVAEVARAVEIWEIVNGEANNKFHGVE
jgi:hypothetical protein